MAFKDDRVSIISDNVRLPFSRDRLIKLVKKILRIAKEDKAKVSISFLNDAKIRRLNLKYRKIDKPTDCLAFPMREGAGKGIHPEMLGDVVISVETAKRNATYFGSTEKKELLLYVVHGILHLLGYTDTDTAAKRKMRKAEGYILNRL